MKKHFLQICILMLSIFASCTPSKSALYNACATDDLKTVMTYYEKFPKKLNAKALQYPFKIALQGQATNTMNYFIKNGYNINIRIDKYETTYLMLAIQKCLLNSVNILLDNNAEMDIFDKNGFSPLFYGITSSKNNDNMISYKLTETLLNHGANPNLKNHDENESVPLFVAMKNNKNDIFNLLLESGANPNEFDKKGFSLLFYAITSKTYDNSTSYSLTETLLKHSANPNLKNLNENESVPLFVAMKNNKNDIFALLLEYGANPNELDKNDEPILIFAIRKNKEEKDKASTEEIIQILLDNDVDVNLKGKDDFTALHLACTYGSFNIVKKILEHNANLNARNYLGQTPLFIATEYGYPDIVSELIKKGADINALDNSGNTALMRAGQFMRNDVLKILLENGAKKDIKNSFGENVFQRIQDNIRIVGNHDDYIPTIEILLDLKSYEEWTPSRFYMQRSKNIGKKIVFKSLLIGDINYDHTINLTDIHCYDFIHNVFYDTYDSETGENLEEKILLLRPRYYDQIELNKKLADFYGYIEEKKTSWGTYDIYFHITHILSK